MQLLSDHNKECFDQQPWISNDSRHWVPHILINDQKQQRLIFCQEQLKKYNHGKAKATYNIVTCNESWIYIYQPKIRLQGKVWVDEDSDEVVQPRRNSSTKKFIITIFFVKKGILYSNVKPQNINATADYYINECLQPMILEWKKQHPKLSLANLTLHQDNATPHTSHSTKSFIQHAGFQTMQAPPYSPDISPCDFWLLPRIKGALAGRMFDSLKQVQVDWNEELSKLQSEDSNKSFDAWFDMMSLVVSVDGNC